MPLETHLLYLLPYISNIDTGIVIKKDKNLFFDFYCKILIIFVLCMKFGYFCVQATLVEY